MSPKNDDSEHDQPASKAEQRGAAKASRGLARETLEAALAHLRGGASEFAAKLSGEKTSGHGSDSRAVASSAPSGGSPWQSPDSESTRFQKEAQLLYEWASQRGLCLGALNPTKVFGREHEVWVGPDRRAWKATHANTFGFGPVFDYTLNSDRKWVPDYVIGPQSPSQYLERLLTACDLFGDDVRLEGVVVEKGGLRIITSQDFVNGRDATLLAIRVFMESLGFESLKEKRSDGSTQRSPYHYYNRELNVAAFDSHEGNVFTMPDGSLHPIDLMLSHPDDELRAVLLQKLSF